MNFVRSQLWGFPRRAHVLVEILHRTIRRMAKSFVTKRQRQMNVRRRHLPAGAIRSGSRVQWQNDQQPTHPAGMEFFDFGQRSMEQPVDATINRTTNDGNTIRCGLEVTGKCNSGADARQLIHLSADWSVISFDFFDKRRRFRVPPLEALLMNPIRMNLLLPPHPLCGVSAKHGRASRCLSAPVT